MKFFQKIFAGNTLYYPGCLTKFAGVELSENYQKILNLEGIEFITLKDEEFCCGSPVKNAGSTEAFKGLAKKNLELFEERGVSRMITNCPGCALVFRKNYPRILGEKWQIEVKLVIEVLDKTIQKKHPDNQKEPQKITYHDPCHLGRQQGVYQLPRKILKKLGFEVVEMEATGKDSFCCGAGGGVNSNNPDLSKRIGEDRVAQAQTTKAQILTTNCPMCHYQLVKGLKELKEDKNLKAKEFSDLILEAQS